MATRNLTNTFIERRNASNLRRRSDTKLTAGGVSDRIKPFGISKKVGGTASDDHLLVEEGLPPMSSTSSSSSSLSMMSKPNTALPPKWVDDVDAIYTNLAEITRLMGVLASLHASRLGSVFGNDLDDMESEIENLTKEITDRFRYSEQLLKKVGAATRVAGGEEAKVGANIQRSLAKKLQELSVEFRQKQRHYLKDVQMQKSGVAAENQAKFGIDFNNDIEDHRVGYSPQQMAMVDDLQEAVQSRDHEIASIAQSIEELGSIFKELAVLVIDQGTVLDRIDYNMEAVVEHTKEGIMQLQKAESHQKSGRPMKCIICLLTTIGILLVILVLKHRRRRW